MEEILNLKKKRIDEIVSECMPQNDSSFGDIVDAMKYSVCDGGKRLRGIMLIEAFRLFCDDRELEKQLAEPYAAALECIHAYSLVHDDLPEMDNDMYRRGKLSTHAKYGQAMGVLAGDALLNYASELIFNAQEQVLSSSFDNRDIGIRAAKAGKFILTASGYSGMIGGQVIDVCSCDDNPDRLESLLNMYELKTSRLFESALCSGAVLGGASDKDTDNLFTAASYLGKAFQIEDDILDITSTLEELGKAVNHDAETDKVTVPALIGLEGAKSLVLDYSDKCLKILKGYGEKADFLINLASYLITRKK